MKKLMRFLKDEEGGNAAEYALIITLVAVALITGATLLGGNINAKLNAVGTKIGTTVP
jgi:pilus assembly protein Flp/PilA